MEVNLPLGKITGDDTAYSNPMVSCELPISTQEAFSKLFADECGFFEAHKESVKASEINMEKWKEADDGTGMMRTIMYRYPLNVVGAPPSTMIREVQRCRFDPGSNELLLDTSCQSLDVPYGTYFTIENRLMFTPRHDNLSCKLEITMQTFFSRSTMLEWKINSNSISSTKESWEGWVSFAQNRLAPPKPSKPNRRGKKHRDAEAAREAAEEAQRAAKLREAKANEVGLDTLTLAGGVAALFVLLLLWAELRLWSAEAAAAALP